MRRDRNADTWMELWQYRKVLLTVKEGDSAIEVGEEDELGVRLHSGK